MKSAKSRILHAAMRLFAEKGTMQIAISDLAKEAGLSRGTIYNNVENPDDLFAITCRMIARELNDSVRIGLDKNDDPALRIATLIRQLIRRVHDEPDWGRFLALFAMTETQIGKFLAMEPADILRTGLQTGRFDFPPEQIHSVTTLAGGAMMGSFSQVLAGAVTWRKSGSEIAALFLRAVGVDPAEAQALASVDFAPLPRLDFAAVAQALPTPMKLDG
ncbi:MAG: TetR/AcrR family transcriptional regulator [Thalassovita sp.]|nr:TetR/AcrR family transcriptional regulator [Thalassovita sp.]